MQIPLLLRCEFVGIVLPASRTPEQFFDKRSILDNSAKLIHQCPVPKRSVSLSTLRGFEAAARLASFALAAKELHLSHSAVSHQIKLLEEELGQPLFRRVGRAVVLTDAGSDFARSVRDILTRLGEGVARLAPYQKPSGVVLYTTRAFAQGFILPRMGQLRAELPDVDLWLDTSERPVDFKHDEIDILISQAEGVAAHGAIDSHLTDDKCVPLASPILIERMGGLLTGTLTHESWPLLHDEGQFTWREWFTSAGLSTTDTVRGTNFSDPAMMIAVAAHGHGFALGSLVCADGFIRNGTLRVLDGPTFPLLPYRIYCDRRTFDDDQVRRVYDWFIREATR